MASSELNRAVTSLAVFALGACLAPPPPEDGPVSIATASDGELSVELLVRGATSLRAGRNTIALALVDEASGAPVLDASISQAWQMTMPEMSHGCPARDPSDPADDQGRYLASVVLPMASSATATWSNRVTVRPAGGAERLLVLAGLEVAQSERAITLSGADGASYLVTLSFAEGRGDNREPTLGDNAYLVTLHEQSGAMSYAPVEDALVQLSADMPAMGHGADAPRAPSHQAEGEYAGAIELPMAGAWRLSFTILRAGVELGVVAFEVAI